jgi:A/G-specific adenine glycosylase
MTPLTRKLIHWYSSHGRKDLPWQKNRDPHAIWISEIMLQQTQVGTVIPFFEKFLERFPDIATLACAGQDEVLHYWSGLGYYARARNLHKAAQIIVDQHQGRFPDKFEDVLALPGIGRSTAGAILSFAFGQHHVILDGNVKRVLTRFHAVEGWPGTTAIADELWKLAATHTPENLVKDYNQAIMDLGAKVCVRTSPACNSCPLSANCAANASGLQERFPTRKQAPVKPVRQTRMAIITQDDNAVFLIRRPAAGIWGGLWAFPEPDDDVPVPEWLRQHYGLNIGEISSGEPFRHTFTHFHLDITPVMARLTGQADQSRDLEATTWYPFSAPPELGLAAPTTRLINLLAGDR